MTGVGEGASGCVDRVTVTYAVEVEGNWIVVVSDGGGVSVVVTGARVGSEVSGG